MIDAAQRLCWTSPTAVTGTCGSAPADATTYSYDTRGNRTDQATPGGTTRALGYDQARQFLNERVERDPLDDGFRSIFIQGIATFEASLDVQGWLAINLGISQLDVGVALESLGTEWIDESNWGRHGSRFDGLLELSEVIGDLAISRVLLTFSLLALAMGACGIEGNVMASNENRHGETVTKATDLVQRNFLTGHEGTWTFGEASLEDGEYSNSLRLGIGRGRPAKQNWISFRVPRGTSSIRLVLGMEQKVPDSLIRFNVTLRTGNQTLRNFVVDYSSMIRQSRIQLLKGTRDLRLDVASTANGGIPAYFVIAVLDAIDGV